ncbi:hypothetical protein CRUP_034985 [Coryphaenoides rupestris]|nr:hypothetical protein CRUP_034985 [Coryphaenoides rupestris]
MRMNFGQAPVNVPINTSPLAKSGAQPDTTGEQEIKRPLREVQWTDGHKKELMTKIRAHRHARVLILGPVGSGKSSFISSVQSVFSGRVLNHAMVGSYTSSFTKKLQTFSGPPNLTMCDVMGLGEGEGSGISFYDILAVIKGHAPEGHKFSISQPLHPDCPGYRKDPGLQDRVHCVVFVLEASQLASYGRGLRGTFQHLREHISDLGIHQVGLLTHIDKVCTVTASDVKNVYKSPTIQQMLDLDSDTDVLLLSAVELIQQYAGLYLQAQTPEM